MAQPKLTATTPRGVFSRRTARKYQFVVLTCGKTEETIRRIHDRDVSRWHQERDYFRSQYVNPKLYTPEEKEAKAEHYQGLIDQADAALAEKLEINAQAIARGEFVCESWTSRRELAEREAKELRKYGRVFVEIYPVDVEEVAAHV